MKNIEKRLVWFLADPSISEKEFDQLERLIEHPHRLFDLIEKARETRRAAVRKSWTEAHEKLHGSIERQYEDELLNQLSQLLLSEAGMTVRTALRALASTLDYEGRLSPSLSFENGVRRIAEEHPQSAILSAATRVRNQVVHSSPNDPRITWPLKGEK